MPTFYNQATLSYNGITTNSNTTAGELVDTLSATKTAISTSYAPNQNVTFDISLINSGNTAFTGLTLEDDMGAYLLGTSTVTPMTPIAGSVRYYINGALQTAPAVTDAPDFKISGITVPALGNASILYEARINSFAPLASGSSITNTATINAEGISAPITATATISAEDETALTISKALSPTTVSENGELTYTFIIQNSGNTPATADASLVISDTFQPILNNISVAYNGSSLSSPTQFTYDTTTGEFATVAGQISVPAASYTQDAQTGAYTITPGVSTLVITGTI